MSAPHEMNNLINSNWSLDTAKWRGVYLISCQYLKDKYHALSPYPILWHWWAMRLEWKEIWELTDYTRKRRYHKTNVNTKACEGNICWATLYNSIKLNFIHSFTHSQKRLSTNSKMKVHPFHPKPDKIIKMTNVSGIIHSLGKNYWNKYAHLWHWCLHHS